MNDAGKDVASVQQVRYGAKRPRRACFTRCGGIQVRPGRGDERTRTVGQDKNQVELAVAAHPAKKRKWLALQWMAGSDHSDRRWIALEVGSVLPFRSTLFRMSSCYERYDDIPTSGGFCCTWSAG